MRDFLKSELENSLIFSNNSIAYGLIIRNPFANILNTDFTLVKLNRNTNDVAVNEVFVDDLKNSKDINHNSFSYNFNKVDNESNIKLHYDLLSRNITMNPNTKYEYNIKFSIMEDRYTIYTDSIETKDISITKDINSDDLIIKSDDAIIQTKTLFTNDSIDIDDIEKDNSIMSIMFIHGYNTPIVKIYNGNSIDNIKYCINNINKLDLNIDCIFNNGNSKLCENKYIEITSRVDNMKQDVELSASIFYNYFDPLYFGLTKNTGLRDIEFINFSSNNDGSYSTDKYENLISRVKVKKENSIYYYCVDGECYNPFFSNNKSFPINDCIIDIIENDSQASKIIEYANILKSIQKDAKFAKYLVIMQDPNLIYKADILDEEKFVEIGKRDPLHCNESTIQLIISAINYNTDVMDINNDNNPKEYKILSYADLSGIQFKYIYDAENDVFAYFDPISRVYFKINNNDIDILDAKIIGLNASKVWIRDNLGIPIFFPNPSFKS